MTDLLSLIEKKKQGEELSGEDLDYLCRGATAGELPDYQLAAWLMAVCWRGMSAEETLALTRAMVATGETLEWGGVSRPVVDKHSTGGVGDKTSLVLVPLLAAAGLAFAKMSGRGLGHTGGTLDKLEAIPGFRVALSGEALQAQVRDVGCALAGQGTELVPADGVLYALRDATATVDCLPLIASSVMSKKIAGGAAAIVLDVKWGSGAFMRSRDAARDLARALVAIGEGAGRSVRAVLSPMQEPLGRAVGNALEVREAIACLRGEGPQDLWRLTEELGTHLLLMTGRDGDADAARERLRQLRASGAGAAKLAELIAAQDGDARVVDDANLLPQAPHVESLRVEASAPRWVAELDARAVGETVVELGGGRRVKQDAVDPAVGVVLHAKKGARVEPGDSLADIHAPDAERAARAAAGLRGAYRFSEQAVPAPVVQYEVVGD